MHGNSKGEVRGRSSYKNNSKTVLRNLEEWIMGTKGKSAKQDLTSAESIPINSNNNIVLSNAGRSNNSTDISFAAPVLVLRHSSILQIIILLTTSRITY